METPSQRWPQGSIILAIPLIENDTAVVRANVSFERGLLRAIDEEAKGPGLTRAAFLAQSARKEIERSDHHERERDYAWIRRTPPRAGFFYARNAKKSPPTG